MKVGFSGYYGMNNYGDDLFAVASIIGSEKFLKDVDVRIIGTEIEGLNAKFSVKFFLNLYRGNSLLSKVYRMYIMFKEFIINDIIILSGGSIVSSDSSTKMRKMMKIFVSLKMAKIAGMGISIGPFHNEIDRKEAEKFLRKFVYLSVRDNKSFELIKNMKLNCKIVNGKDLAGLIISNNSLIPKSSIVVNEKHILGVSLCNYERYNSHNNRDEELRNISIHSAIVKLMTENDIQLKIFVLNTHLIQGDIEISEKLFKELTDKGFDVKIIYNKSNPLKIWQEISSCNSFFSIRMHGGITAFLQQKSFSLVEYHEKCTEFLNDINQKNELRLPRKIKTSQEVYNVLKKLVEENNYYILPIKKYVEGSKKNFSDFH